MTSRFLPLLILFFTQAVFAQNAADSVAVVANWKKGEKVYFQKNTVKQEFKNGQTVKSDSVSIEVSLTVTDSSETGYVLLFQMEKLPLAIPMKLMEKFAGKFEYELETSATGEYLGLRNWEAVRQQMSNTVEKIAVLNQENRESRAQITAALKGMFETKEQIESITYKELAVLLDGFGYQYPLNEEIKVETQMPNPFGGTPFQGFVTNHYTLSGADVVHISSRTDLEPVSTKAAIVQILKEMAKKMGKDESEVEVELSQFELTITDEKIQSINLTTGWLEHGRFERKTETKDANNRQGKLERHTYKRIEKK